MFFVVRQTRGLNLLIRVFITILRPLAWILGLVYLLVEAREMFVLQQLASITIFAVFALVASFQMKTSQLLMRLGNHSSIDAFRAGILMFVAALFSMVDAAIDVIISSLQSEISSILLLPFFVIGWLINLSSVILALVSAELFIKIIRISLLSDLRSASTESFS